MSGYYSVPPAAVPVRIGDLHCLLKRATEEHGQGQGGGDGKNIRVFGRVSLYDAESQVLKLTEPANRVDMTRARHDDGNEPDTAQAQSGNVTVQGVKSSSTSSQPKSVLVDTSLIGSLDFHCRKGAQVLCVGELQTWSDSRLAEEHMEQPRQDDYFHSDTRKSWEEGDIGGPVVKATICKLCEELDYEKYCQYVEVIRRKTSQS